MRKRIEHPLRRLSIRLKHEAVAIEHHRDAGRVRDAKGLGGAHNRPLQTAPLRSSRPERWVICASTPSAAVPPWFFNAFARTVETTARPLPSASLATVRRDASAKPLAGLDFGMGADDADGVDGSAPAFS